MRHARSGDAGALATFDVGEDASVWLDEVKEIVNGLVAWRDTSSAAALDRRVIVMESDDAELVGVCADEALVDHRGEVHVEHCYLMVHGDQVRPPSRRTGTTSRRVRHRRLQSSGATTVTWLVHPGNAAAIAFSRTAFPQADETYPSQDRPYVAFTLTL